ncbi:hypothetical protein TcWFU_003963 [Taenia crassiceps]|uniref:Uncharacterized protein n=1 Tax=Taenia crassiceps TaxID=6207 RepID=A0ABR4PZJ4_9CEST
MIGGKNLAGVGGKVTQVGLFGRAGRNLWEEDHHPHESPEGPSIEAFDAVVYLANPTSKRHVGRNPWHHLERLINRILSITPDAFLRLPILLILDIESEQTEDSTPPRGRAFQEDEEPPVDPNTCDWWRVWRLHQREGIFVNMFEAFQWAALQITTLKGKGSSEE